MESAGCAVGGKGCAVMQGTRRCCVRNRHGLAGKGSYRRKQETCREEEERSQGCVELPERSRLTEGMKSF